MEVFMSRICYRKLRPYKYQVMEDYNIRINIEAVKEIGVPNYVILTPTGDLTIKERYAWDGPSGPTFDTKTFMRGSLVHDALYQLMRESLLGLEHRKTADEILRDICLEDGMFKFRAWYVYKAVRLFGSIAAKPVPKRPVKMIYAPE